MEELMGRAVVGTSALVLGEVCDIQFDEKAMRLTSICVKLNDNALEPMGIKKPRLGSVKVDIPIETVKAIGDVVNLDRNAHELGPLAKRR